MISNNILALQRVHLICEYFMLASEGIREDSEKRTTVKVYIWQSSCIVVEALKCLCYLKIKVRTKHLEQRTKHLSYLLPCTDNKHMHENRQKSVFTKLRAMKMSPDIR